MKTGDNEMESQSFFKEIYSLINSNIQKVIDVMQGEKQKEGSPLIKLSTEDIQLLQSIKLTKAQLIVLKKALIETERNLIFGVLCIIDGVTYTVEDIPDLALVNRSTGKSINQDFLHDEFYEAMYDK